ncbi:MAG: 3-dehydroquinate synthase [Treponema sp.]
MQYASNSYSFSTSQGSTCVHYYDERPYIPKVEKQMGKYNALYVCDEHTLPLLQAADNFMSDVPLVCLPAGEQYKDMQRIEQIIAVAVQAELDRNALFIAFGGGVVCDMTALAASLYLRGVSCVLVPSTVLAMADASIGGKTAVNFSAYKNLMGTFYAASDVFICLPLLQKLPEREYHAGLAEILKVGVLYEPAVYRIFLEERRAIMQREPACIGKLIRLATQAKARVISADFTEQGERRFLNFGHTFAHALESISQFSILHGDAVAWGMARALALGSILKITEPTYTQTLTELLHTYGWCTAPVYTGVQMSEKAYGDALIEAMRKDKKKQNGSIRFILQKTLQSNLILAVDETLIRKVLQ